MGLGQLRSDLCFYYTRPFNYLQLYQFPHTHAGRYCKLQAMKSSSCVGDSMVDLTETWCDNCHFHEKTAGFRRANVDCLAYG
jgi:hypothetical protein